MNERRILAKGDDTASVFLVADEVEMAELGDRVAEAVVERAERLLAAVEMDDRHPLDGRGDGRGHRLEPVADEHEAIRWIGLQRIADELQRAAGLLGTTRV